MNDTVIIFTSDHGDYLGDHWLGEKELFHEESVRIPFIVYEPSMASDVSRGKVDDRLVESIDLVPTLIDIAGGNIPNHILEGRSLLPLLHGENPKNWRSYVVSESEYASRIAFWDLGLEAHEARATMIRTEDWKYIFHESFRPELFDMKNDPEELCDLGEDQAYNTILQEMRDLMFESLRRRRTRTTRDNDYMKIRAKHALANNSKRPVYIGVW
jgi:arylsulfatase A-like enzyme